MRIFVVGSNGVSLAIRLAGMRSLQLGIERHIGQIYHVDIAFEALCSN